MALYGVIFWIILGSITAIYIELHEPVGDHAILAYFVVVWPMLWIYAIGKLFGAYLYEIANYFRERRE